MSPWTKAPVSEKEHPLGACERSLGCEPQYDVIGVTPNVVPLSGRGRNAPVRFQLSRSCPRPDRAAC